LLNRLEIDFCRVIIFPARMSSDAVAPAVAASPADTVLAPPTCILLQQKEFVALLPPSPTIRYDEATHRHYYLCSYSNLPCSDAVCFPETVLKGTKPKSGNAPRLRGRFMDYNCMCAWLVEQRPRITDELYKFILDYVVHAAGAHGKSDFYMAPPKNWLHLNNPTDPKTLDPHEWLASYKGRRYEGCDVRVRVFCRALIFQPHE
jgi:hypothetical protein